MSQSEENAPRIEAEIREAAPDNLHRPVSRRQRGVGKGMTRTRRRGALLIGALVALAAPFLMLPGTAHAASGTARAPDPPHFSFTRYATVSPATGWSFVAGQFAGDGRSDIVGYHPSNGSVWVGRNTG